MFLPIFDKSCPGYDLFDDDNDGIQPPILHAPPVHCNPPFNFFAFLRQSSGHAESIPQLGIQLSHRPGPIIDHSERAGGGVR